MEKIRILEIVLQLEIFKANLVCWSVPLLMLISAAEQPQPLPAAAFPPARKFKGQQCLCDLHRGRWEKGELSLQFPEVCSGVDTQCFSPGGRWEELLLVCFQRLMTPTYCGCCPWTEPSIPLLQGSPSSIQQRWFSAVPSTCCLCEQGQYLHPPFCLTAQHVFLGTCIPLTASFHWHSLQHLAVDQMEFNSSFPASGHQICCHPFQCRHYLGCSVSI